MRKALLPLLASLLICGTATAALIAGNARAEQTSHKPVMMLAQNQAAPPAGPEAGTPPRDVDDMMRGPRPGQICQDLYARKAAQMAFLEAKLDLTPAQQPLFARWKDVSMDIAKRRQGDCGAHVQNLRARQRPDMMERLSREEDRLKTRLADIEAERPALGALYAALNPTQKQDFGRAARRALERRVHMAMGMMHRIPPMGRRLGRGGPDGAPPPPPAPPPQ